MIFGLKLRRLDVTRRALLLMVCAALVARPTFAAESFDLTALAALLDEALAQGRGAVMLGAHLGSFEALQAVGEQHANMRVAMVM